MGHGGRRLGHMNALLNLIHMYGTRAIGVSAGTLTTLCGTGIIPNSQMKYWMAALAILTYWRGQTTSNTYNKVMEGAVAAPTESPFAQQMKAKP